MTTKVVFTGEYDVAAKERLREEFDRLVNEPIAILDFTAVTYIDSTCVTELLRLRDLRAQSALPPPAILMKSDNPVRRIFEILDLLSAFEFLEDADSFDAGIRYAFAGDTTEMPVPFHQPGL